MTGSNELKINLKSLIVSGLVIVVTTTFLQHDYWYMMAKLPNWNYIDSRDPNNVTLLTEIHDDWIEF